MRTRGRARLDVDHPPVPPPRRPSSDVLAAKLNALAECLNAAHAALSDVRHELHVESVDLERRMLPLKRMRR